MTYSYTTLWDVTHWWGRGWIWAALGVLIGIMMAMYPLASEYYNRVRKAVGLPFQDGMRKHPPVDPAPAEELEALLVSSRPYLIAAIGVAGLVAIVYLMMLKPF